MARALGHMFGRCDPAPRCWSMQQRSSPRRRCDWHVGSCQARTDPRSHLGRTV